MLRVFSRGLEAYEATWEKMRTFTASRTPETPDECWLLEHYPVFTQGQAGKPEHILGGSKIPVVQTDRGGQVTYHGPGQLVAYVLWDIKRLGVSVRDLVHGLEESVIRVLDQYGVEAVRVANAPGIYVEDAKIASLGLRVRRGFTYHGLAFNVAMDLTPFQSINPCGYKNLRMTQLSAYAPATLMDVGHRLIQQFQHIFGYQDVMFCQ